MYKILDKDQESIYLILIREIKELYNLNFLSHNRFKSGSFFLQGKLVKLVDENSLKVNDKIIEPFYVYGNEVGFTDVTAMNNSNKIVQYKVTFQMLEKRTFVDWVTYIEEAQEVKRIPIKRYNLQKMKENIILS